MTERRVERGLNAIIGAVSSGRLGVITSPEYLQEWKKVLAEERNLVCRIFDSGNLFIVNDEQGRIVPRFKIIRKQPAAVKI